MTTELTPGLIRRLCKELGGSTNSQATDVQEACVKILAGSRIDDAIATVRYTNGRERFKEDSGIRAENEESYCNG